MYIYIYITQIEKLLLVLLIVNTVRLYHILLDKSLHLIAFNLQCLIPVAPFTNMV